MTSLESLSPEAISRLKAIVRDEIELEELMEKLYDLRGTILHMNYCIDDESYYLHTTRKECCIVQGETDCADDAEINLSRINKLTKNPLCLLVKPHIGDSIVITSILQEMPMNIAGLKRLGANFVYESFDNVIMLYDKPQELTTMDFISLHAPYEEINRKLDFIMNKFNIDPDIFHV